MSRHLRLAVLGASGHGKVVADIALLSGWQDVLFYDDAWPKKESLEHWRLKGSFDDLLNNLDDFDSVVVAIGNNAVREEKLKILQQRGACIVSLIHPRATVSQFSTIESGSVVVAGAVVNAFAKIGGGCIVNTGATVGHDCQLGSCVHIAPGANVAGNVVIGRCGWVGVGSAVRQGVSIGESAIVGAGAVVVSDISAGVTVVGSPARPVD